MSEAVNHPAHYGGEGNPYEHIKVVEAWGLNYALGSATKYICRAHKKGDVIENLRKALFWVQHEVDRLEKERRPPGTGEAGRVGLEHAEAAPSAAPWPTAPVPAGSPPPSAAPWPPDPVSAGWGLSFEDDW